MNRRQRRAAKSQGIAIPARPLPAGPTDSSAQIAEWFRAAFSHHQAGRLAEAESLYRQILAFDPYHVDSLHFLGVLAGQAGRNDIAIDLIGRAVALKPGYGEAHYNLGNALAKANRLDDAAAHYAQVLGLKPDFAEAHNSLGTVRSDQGKLAEATACFERALRFRPDFAEARYNQGLALTKANRLDDAVTQYEQALALRPGYHEAHYNLGNVLKKLGRLDDAATRYERALALKPDFADAHNGLGAVLVLQDNPMGAMTCFERALALKPDFADAHYNRGVAFGNLQRPTEALASYDRALALDPGHADAHYNRGIALRSLKRFAEALASFEQALALKPDYADAHYNRGLALGDLNRVPEALESHERALSLKPNFPEAKFARCTGQLPVLYMSEPEIERQRAAYKESLKAFCDDVDRDPAPADLAKGVGASQPFFLPYQGYNDRDLQSRYGAMVCRIMEDRYPPVELGDPPRAGEPIRVGIVSGFFREHSNWKIPIKGWISQLDRQQFRILAYHTGSEQDKETGVAASLCERFVQGPLTVDRWRQTILADAPHVLLYPEIGMDPMVAQLAAQRLAAVQCTSWGHPETSGFPTLDYYLSSDLMEPPDGQEHYSERLVRLPNLSIYYEPIDAPPMPLSRRELELRPGAAVYWCGQSLFKYLPHYDEVFPRIAREVGDCQFVFIEYQRGTTITDLFQTRLTQAFAAHGLRAADHCIFLSRLDHPHFIAAMGLCDIVLDSIGWSGCNSTLEGLPLDLPIVTMAGPLMRGRHSAAILEMIGATDTIARTVDDYVSIAVRLARDDGWRATVKRNIAANKNRVYRDRSCISALSEFFIRVARKESPS